LALDADYNVAYGYDQLGRFNQIGWTVQGNVNTATYAYVENSDMIAGYDVASGTNVLQMRRSFDSNRDLIAAVSNRWNGGLVSAYDYQNDAVGRRTQRLDTLPAGPSTNAFGYNARSELTAALMGTNNYGYCYDPIGNREWATNNQELTTYLANSLNQYTNIVDGVTNNPTYDSDGNLLTCGGWTYAWDAENRLASASNGAAMVTFAYDYQGRRVEKEVYAYDSSNWQLTTENRFVYDGWNLICDYTGNGGAPPVRDNLYVWGLDLSGTLQGAGGVGGLLCRKRGHTWLYCYDGNGNPVQMLRNTDGYLGANYLYDPFGNATETTASGVAQRNRFRFSTKYTDDETGLVYYGQRYYNPNLGRWLSRDPIEDMSEVGCLYAFVGNAPIDSFDLLGLRKCEVERFHFSVVGWEGGFPGKMVLKVKFDLVLKPCVSTKDCVISQKMIGECSWWGARREEIETKGPPWVPDEPKSGPWWDGWVWYHRWPAGAGKWSMQKGQYHAVFYDKPGLVDIQTDNFPVYKGGPKKQGHYKYYTFIKDKDTKQEVDHKEWGILIDYKTATSGRRYYYY